MKHSFHLILLLMCVGCVAHAIEPENATDEESMTVLGSKVVGEIDLPETALIKLYENKLPKVVSVKVSQKFHDPRSREEQKRRDPWSMELCDRRTKRPNEQDVKDYFTLANEISSYTAVQTLDSNSCIAKGTLKFADGKQAEWMLTVTGKGYLLFPDRSSGHFYCPKCSDLFALDLDDKNLKAYGRDPKAGDTFKE